MADDNEAEDFFGIKEENSNEPMVQYKASCQQELDDAAVAEAKYEKENFDPNNFLIVPHSYSTWLYEGTAQLYCKHDINDEEVSGMKLFNGTKTLADSSKNNIDTRHLATGILRYTCSTLLKTSKRVGFTLNVTVAWNESSADDQYTDDTIVTINEPIITPSMRLFFPYKSNDLYKETIPLISSHQQKVNRRC